MKLPSNIIDIIHRKNRDNIVQLKLGKQLDNDMFNYKIDIRQFENLLEKIKNAKDFANIEYKNYNKYYDNDKIYIIHHNGDEEYLTNLSKDSVTFLLKNHMDIQINTIIYERLKSDAFQLKYKYDKIINIQSICFNYENFIIEFNKVSDDIVYHEINIIITHRSAKINNVLNFL